MACNATLKLSVVAVLTIVGAHASYADTPCIGRRKDR